MEIATAATDAVAEAVATEATAIAATRLLQAQSTAECESSAPMSDRYPNFEFACLLIVFSCAIARLFVGGVALVAPQDHMMIKIIF